MFLALLLYRYEGRSGFPSDFDATYCYGLGNVAGALIQNGVLVEAENELINNHRRANLGIWGCCAVIHAGRYRYDSVNYVFH